MSTRTITQAAPSSGQSDRIGIALTVLTLGTLYFLGPVIERVLPRAPQSGLGNVMNGLVRDPWRLALFLGPILLIGTACFEEVARDVQHMESHPLLLPAARLLPA